MMIKRIGIIFLGVVLILSITACKGPWKDAGSEHTADLSPIIQKEQELFEDGTNLPNETVETNDPSFTKAPHPEVSLPNETQTPTNEPSQPKTEETFIFGTDAQRTITVKNNRLNTATAYPLSFEEKKQLIELLNKGERKEFIPLLDTDLLLNIDGNLWHYDTAEGLAFGGIPNTHIVFDLETTKQINKILLAQFKASTDSN